MKRILAVVLFALVPSLASAQALAPKNNYARYGAVISAATMDATRSFSIANIPNVGAWGLMNVYVNVTDANNSITALNMTCTASRDDNTTDYSLLACETSSGTSTCYVQLFTINPAAISTPKKLLFRVDIEGLEDVECSFTTTGGAAADLLTVNIDFATKGS